MGGAREKDFASNLVCCTVFSFIFYPPSVVWCRLYLSVVVVVVFGYTLKKSKENFPHI